MEFIYDGSDFYLIDINPRFSAGVAFSSMVGYDMVLAHLNCFVGKQILPPVEYKEQIVAKRYVEVKLCVK
jgi:carbamoyl-phosphate synthase large subunit